MRAGLDALEIVIGYRFGNREILVRALTHSSHVHERVLVDAGQPAHDNEQLEFLGDAVLGFLVSEALVQRYPQLSEGRLSKMKARLVSAAFLYEVARKLDLCCYLFIGLCEEMSGGRAKRTLLVDSLEAVIAALYLDGGIAAASQFIRQFVVEPALESIGIDAPPSTLVDYKSALQELAQARHLPQPRYTIVKE